MENDKLVRLSDVINFIKTSGWLDYPPHAEGMAEELTERLPAVDALEVRHGHWVTEEEAIEKDDYSLRDTCSVCGHCDWDCTESENFNYCPNCGAKMDDVYQPPICGPGEEDGDGNADSM